MDGTAYDQKVDLWSLGVVTYLLLGDALPFEHNNPFILERYIKLFVVWFLLMIVERRIWEVVSGMMCLWKLRYLWYMSYRSTLLKCY